MNISYYICILFANITLIIHNYSLVISMAPEELQKLKLSLPKNHLDELSLRTGFSKTYIWQVLNGERNNVEIIDQAIVLAKEEKLKEEKRKEEVANL